MVSGDTLYVEIKGEQMELRYLQHQPIFIIGDEDLPAINKSKCIDPLIETIRIYLTNTC